jgi:hypothetical protein
LKYRNEAGPTCQSQQLIKTLAPGYRSPVHVRAIAAGHAPEARAPPATRSAPWRLCCPCALTKTRPYLLEAEAKEPFSSSHSPSLALLSRRAATLLCSGRRRAADSSRLLPSSGAPRRCRADTSVPERIDGRRAPCKLPTTTFHRREDVTGDSQVRPWNRPADVTVSTAGAPNFSPSQAPPPPDDALHVVPLRSPTHRRGARSTVSFSPLQPLNRAPSLTGLLLDLFPRLPALLVSRNRSSTAAQCRRPKLLSRLASRCASHKAQKIARKYSICSSNDLL